MRRRFYGTIIALFLLTLALAVAGCGGGGSGGSSGGAANEVDLGAASFEQTSVTLNSGQPLHIVDPQASGGTHNLCLGQNGNCDSTMSGPSELQRPGMMINAGDTKDITFSAAGTYHVTCTIHPNMNLTVTVK
jgi:plastocyanin